MYIHDELRNINISVVTYFQVDWCIDLWSHFKNVDEINVVLLKRSNNEYKPMKIQ